MVKENFEKKIVPAIFCYLWFFYSIRESCSFLKVDLGGKESPLHVLKICFVKDIQNFSQVVTSRANSSLYRI